MYYKQMVSYMVKFIICNINLLFYPEAFILVKFTI